MENEIIELNPKIQEYRKLVNQAVASEFNIDRFIALVKKYIYVEKLTPEILDAFIEKIVVHHREKIGKETIQKVKIYYKMVGDFEISNLTELEPYKKSFARKETLFENKKSDVAPYYITKA